MLRILGNPKRLCDGITRRDLLQLGGLGAFGMGLADVLRWNEAAGAQAEAEAKRGKSLGRAKSCILLFPYGSPPQHETFDPKPDAPLEIRGEMGCIETNVPGVRICEGLPRIARVMDKVTVVRSMTHPYPLHGLAYAVSGIPTYTPAIETVLREPSHWPFIGSMVDYIDEHLAPSVKPPIPRNVALPWVVNSKVKDLGLLAGPYAAFLGQAHDPVWTEFAGKGTQIAPKIKFEQVEEFMDPYKAVDASGYFTVAPEDQLASDLPVGRIEGRRTLLAQFDQARAFADASQASSAFDRHRATALEMVTQPRFRTALDVRREPASVRERYGMTLFGQSCLAARRLVEAGGRFITVFWDCFGLFGNGAWDTHANHYPRLKEYLLPAFDLAYSALLNDLEERGLLDDTLVMWLSEHGRTPQIDSKPKGAGRHHWSRVYSTVYAGGGIARGRVVGASDKIGGDVRDTPVSPKDILATAFHLLGIDPDTTAPDRFNRPVRIVGAGSVREELL